MKAAAYIKEKRVAAGLSQGEVAKKLGYDTPQFISNWERAVSYPPIESIKILADLYKCSAQEMFEVVQTALVDRAVVKAKNQFKRSSGFKGNRAG